MPKNEKAKNKTKKTPKYEAPKLMKFEKLEKLIVCGE